MTRAMRMFKGTSQWIFFKIIPSLFGFDTFCLMANFGWNGLFSTLIEITRRSCSISLLGQNDRHFVKDIFERIFIFVFRFEFTDVWSEGSNRIGHKPLAEPMLTQSPRIYVTLGETNYHNYLQNTEATNLLACFQCLSMHTIGFIVCVYHCSPV